MYFYLVLAAASIFMACNSSRPKVSKDFEDKPVTSKPTAEESEETRYFKAYEQAQLQESYLHVYFFDPKPSSMQTQFEEKTLVDRTVTDELEKSVYVKIDKSRTLLDEEKAFTNLEGKAGVATVDLRQKGQAHFGKVVGVFPFVAISNSVYSPASPVHFSEFLKLPNGSQTQRSLIFAVRVHQQRPRSAYSALSSVLSSETEKHSLYQAQIRQQGHHNWDTRFHQINAKLQQTHGRSLTATEVAAESWPNQRMLESAFECVHSWSQSAGHWRAVMKESLFYGYDMALGVNGIWYCTGMFAE